MKEIVVTPQGGFRAYPATTAISPVSLKLIQDLANKFKQTCGSRKPLFVFCGTSGALIAGLFAKHFKDFGMYQVRKENEIAHSSARTHVSDHSYKENGDKRDDLFPVFVDDLVDSGAQFLYVQRVFEERYTEKLRTVVVLTRLGRQTEDFDKNVDILIRGQYNPW